MSSIYDCHVEFGTGFFHHGRFISLIYFTPMKCVSSSLSISPSLSLSHAHSHSLGIGIGDSGTRTWTASATRRSFCGACGSESVRANGVESFNVVPHDCCMLPRIRR